MSKLANEQMGNSPTEDKTRLISLAEAAEQCGLSRAALRRYAWQGKLRAHKIGNMWVTTMEDVEEYLARRQRKRQPRQFD